MTGLASDRKKKPVLETWSARFIAAAKTSPQFKSSTNSEKKYEVIIECHGDYDYGEGTEVEVLIGNEDSLGDFTIFSFNAAQLPTQCGVMVLNGCPSELSPSLWPFFFDVVNAYAKEVNYGLILMSHVKGDNSLKAAEANGYSVLHALKNPNSGNNIVLVSKLVSADVPQNLATIVSENCGR